MGLKQKIEEKRKRNRQERMELQVCQRDYDSMTERQREAMVYAVKSAVEGIYDNFLGLIEDARKQIQGKIINIDFLPNPDEQMTRMTIRKFCEDFNQQIKKILAVLDEEEG